MKVFLLLLLFNIVSTVHVSEILMERRRKKGSNTRSSAQPVISSESSGEGNRTTLTFGEMVGIYHDIWNAMLLGGTEAEYSITLWSRDFI